MASPLTGASRSGRRRSCGTAPASVGTLRDGEYRAVVEATNELGSDLVRRSVRLGHGRATGAHPPRQAPGGRGQRAVDAHLRDRRPGRFGARSGGGNVVRIPWTRSCDASSRRRLGRGGERERSRRPRPAPRLAPDRPVDSARADACRPVREGRDRVDPSRTAIPFLLIDEVTELEPGRRVVARRSVNADDWWFRGHFPERRRHAGRADRRGDGPDRRDRGARRGGEPRKDRVLRRNRRLPLQARRRARRRAHARRARSTRSAVRSAAARRPPTSATRSPRAER